MPETQVVSNQHDRCGECPLWDDRRGRMLWIDNAGGTIHAWTPDTSTYERLFDDVDVHAIVLNHDDRLIVASALGIHALDPQGHRQPIVVVDDGSGAWCLNDMIAGPSGCLYAGSFHWGVDDRGAERMIHPGRLYRITPDGAPEVMDDGIGLSNGLALGDDGQTLYFVDSAERRIHRYAIHPETGKVEDKHLLHHFADDEGLPDGIACDAYGGVWVALWYGGRIVRLDRDGRVTQTLAVPATQPSSVAFGGRDGADLYITTATEFWPSPMQPPGVDPDAHCGGELYRIRGIGRGAPVFRAAIG